MKEVPFYDFAVDCKEISAPLLSPPQHSVTFHCSAKKAGAEPLTAPASSARSPESGFLTWSVDAGHEGVGVLEVVELGASQRFPENAVRLRVSGDIVGCFVVPGGAEAPSSCVVAVTADGVVCTLDLESARAEACDVSGSLARLEEVEALAVSPVASDVVLFAGGRNGNITCVPLHPPGPSFDLREGDPMLRRLFGGILTGGKGVAPVTALSARVIKDVMLLFACHADGAVRVWDVDRRQRLLAQQLGAPIPSGGALVPSDVEVGLSASGDVALVALVCGDAHAQGGTAVFVYGLNVQPLELEKPNLPAFNLIRRISIDPQVSVADVRLVRDELWLLLGSEKARHVVERYGLSREDSEPRGCVLLEEAVAELLLQGSSDAELAWEDLLFALQFLSPEQQEGGDPSAALEEIFLDRLMSPVALLRPAIRRTLEVWGRQLSTADTSSLSLEGLRTEVAAAVHAKAGSGRVGEELRRWSGLCRDYVACRHELQVPLCILADSGSGAVGLLRRGAASMFRHMDSVEHIVPTGDKEPQLPEEWHLSEEHEAVLRVLAGCGRQLSRQLGRLACAALEADLLLPHGGSSQGLLPKLLPILELGYTSSGVSPAGDPLVGPEDARRRDQAARSSQRVFAVRMARQLASLGQLSSGGAGWPQALGLVGGYLSQLAAPLPTLPAGAESGPGGGTSATSAACTRAAAVAVCQVARARYEAARDTMLLLSHLASTWAQVGMSARDLEHVQLKLLPQARQVLTETLMLMWLAGTFSTPPRVRAADDFSSQLSALHIADGRWQSQAEARRGLVLDRTLGEVLLGAFLERPEESRLLRSHLTAGGLAPEALGGAARQLLSVLRWGGAEGAVATEEEGFQWRVIQLALVFLETYQYDALQVLLLAIERSTRDGMLPWCDRFKASESAGGEAAVLSFLLGFCSLACAKTSARTPGGTNTHESRRAHLARAARYFFRAATGMESGGDALLNILEKHFNAAAVIQPNLPGRERASRKLQYFELVMLIFERYNEREGACQFAHAALEQGDIAVKQQAADGMITDYNQMLALKGRLWANVFKFSLDLGRYDEAYSAIVSNPDDDTKRVCLRRFVIVLCERSAGQVLCGKELPYAGVLEKVEQELIWKAEGSDIRAKPSPYGLLYAFHATRCNWRRAATSMYRYATRLAAEKIAANSPRQASVAVLQEHVEALGAAINALHLVAPENAWLDLRPFSSALPELPSPQKRARFALSTVAAGAGNLKEDRVEYVVSLEDMEKEHALASARLHLARAVPNKPVPGVALLPKEVLGLLIEAELYDRAFSIALLFWNNTSQKRELERIFEAMTRRACYLQMQTSGPPATRSVAGSADVAPGKAGVVSLLLASEDAPLDQSEARHLSAPELWQQLESHLGKYDGLHSKLREVVATTILAVDPRMQLPRWLTRLFKGGREGKPLAMARTGGDPSALLRIYLDHGLLADATSLVLECLHALAAQRSGNIRRKQSCTSWFAYTLVDRLKQQLADAARSGGGPESVTWQSKLQQLTRSLDIHFQQVKADNMDTRHQLTATA